MVKRQGLGEGLSRRYLDVLDAYEEFLLLRDLLTKIDDCRAWLRRKGLREQEPCFLLPQFAEVRERVWYIEVSRQAPGRSGRGRRGGRRGLCADIQ